MERKEEASEEILEGEISDGENEIKVEDSSFMQSEPVQDGTGPPKLDSPIETLQEKVKKQIIKEGHGEVPSKLSTCFLHYRAWVEKSSHKIEDTWQENHPIELILGKEKKEMSGLGIGVASMKTGERALLYVGSELGFGKEGNFSFPNVPPMADLVYEVELVGFDELKEGKARADMTVEERIEAADKRKQKGNLYFTQDKLSEAMQQYEMGVAYMGDDFMFQLFGKYRDMALAVKNPCHLNMAQCLIKLERFDEAIGQCTIVLSEDENNTKALFRRGKARAALSQTDSARTDLEKALKLVPGDKAIIHELKLISQHEKEVYQKQRELYKGLFAKKEEEKGVKEEKRNFVVVLFLWIVGIFRRVFKGGKSE